MKCPECGVELSGEDKFCNNCGAAIPASETPEPVPQDKLQQVAEDVLPEAEDDAGDVILEAEDVPDETESVLEDIEPLAAEEPPAEEPQPAEEPPLAAEPQPDFEPEPGDSPAAPPVAQAKSKPNTALIIAIVVLVLLLLCCCCAIAILGLNWNQIVYWLNSL